MRPSTQRTGSRDGFTLVEALIASTIFALMSVASIGMLLMSAAAMEGNALDSHGVALAVQEKEDVRSINYPAIAALTSRDPYTTASPDIFNGTKFTVHTDIAADQPMANVCTITTTVSWSYKGSPRSYMLRSIYAAVNS